MGETDGKISKNADTSEKGSKTWVICKNSRNPVCNFSNVQFLYLKESSEAAAFTHIPWLSQGAWENKFIVSEGLERERRLAAGWEEGKSQSTA